MSKITKRSVRAARSAAPTDVPAASNAADNPARAHPPDTAEGPPASRDNPVVPTETALAQIGTSTAVELGAEPCRSKRIGGDQTGHRSHDEEKRDEMSRSKLTHDQTGGDDNRHSSRTAADRDEGTSPFVPILEDLRRYRTPGSDGSRRGSSGSRSNGRRSLSDLKDEADELATRLERT